MPNQYRYTATSRGDAQAVVRSAKRHNVETEGVGHTDTGEWVVIIKTEDQELVRKIINKH